MQLPNELLVSVFLLIATYSTHCFFASGLTLPRPTFAPVTMMVLPVQSCSGRGGVTRN